MSALDRFLGGSPIQVILRLIVISFVVGVILAWLGVSPHDIFGGLERFVRRIWAMGFDAFDEIWRYFALGAVVVIPIFVLVRLLNIGRGRG
ncbi:DUF6460 domain-containing protein [Prosthecomicrobium pneumaticum]|uniref:DUF6460 domain-containing protein n=1 Tax=Prosthecomicrobium pneumaticum TaxID=81895 RepID=A0A7W9FMF8_9HYPH|nr:DUF6460 domain-containing protein [Prosthecomicrobium pneumaticum]MBB5753385.1 hypothetical protein [Prosthecomicrobium pneumaticum]